MAGVFDALVADCPHTRTSPNAPSNRDVIGTIVRSVRAGHKRYAHVTTLRADGVRPELWEHIALELPAARHAQIARRVTALSTRLDWHRTWTQMVEAGRLIVRFVRK